MSQKRGPRLSLTTKPYVQVHSSHALAPLFFSGASFSSGSRTSSVCFLFRDFKILGDRMNASLVMLRRVFPLAVL